MDNGSREPPGRKPDHRQVRPRLTKKTRGLPPRRLIRHLIAKPRKGGAWAYYWQPPSKYRRIDGRPAWLKATPLKDERGFLSLERAMKAAELLNAKLDGWRAGQGPQKGEVAALLKAWQASADYRRMADKTRLDYERHVKALTDDLGEVSAAEMTKPAIAVYGDHMADKGLGPRTRAYRLAVIRQFWNWASRRGLVTGDNPASKLGIKAPKPVRGLWTVEQLAAVCALPYPMGLAVRLALYTLQRQGDLLDLRWSDIQGRSISLRQNKTGKDLTLPLCRRLRAALKLAPRRGETILATSRGTPYTEDGFRSIWQRHAKGRDWPTFHSLRRTASTWLQLGGMTDEELMLWTGHSRQGDEATLDPYIVRGAAMAAKGHPIMQRWRV